MAGLRPKPQVCPKAPVQIALLVFLGGLAPTLRLPGMAFRPGNPIVGLSGVTQDTRQAQTLPPALIFWLRDCFTTFHSVSAKLPWLGILLSDSSLVWEFSVKEFFLYLETCAHSSVQGQLV